MSHCAWDKRFKDNGGGRCWHCGNPEAEHAAPTPDKRAWTGGDTPRDHVGGFRGALRNPAYRSTVRRFMREQLKDWNDFWADMPDPDTARIFAGRARLDAWRTLYPR